MAVGAFPLAKLGVLAMKQVSKPIANYLKRQAKNHNVVRKYIVIPPAQMYHRLETTVKLLLLGLGRPTSVTPLTESVAVELGGDMLGEFIVFSIASAILIAEYNRQSDASSRKEEALQDRLGFIEERLHDTTIMVEHQKAMIRQLEHQIAYNSSPIARVKSIFTGKEGKLESPENSSKPEPPKPSDAPPVLIKTPPVQSSLFRSISVPNSTMQNPVQTVLERSMTEGNKAIGVER